MTKAADNEAFARHVQARLGLPVDGWAGPKTHAAFDAAVGINAPPPVNSFPPATDFAWDDRSDKNLNGVHPDLARVVALARAQSSVPFIVTEGLRTRERQAQLVRAGASQTMNSRHLTGHAIDVAAKVGGQIRWDWPLYERIARAMKEAAAELSVPIVWGGDWRSFKDGPHFELNRNTYP